MYDPGGMLTLIGKKSSMRFVSRLLSLILFLLVGYAAYRIIVCHPITCDPAKAYDFTLFYLSDRSAFFAAIFAAVLAVACLLCAKFCAAICSFCPCLR